jgi:hypothetical protein
MYGPGRPFLSGTVASIERWLSPLADWIESRIGVLNATSSQTIRNDIYYVRVDSTSGDVTITLPYATGHAGKQITVEKISSDANTVTLATLGSDTINGSATKTASSQYDFWTVIADGSTKWEIISVSPGIATTVTVSDAGGDTETFPLLGTAATGDLAPRTDAGLMYNATTNALTAGSFIGALTGNADTVTTNANLTGPITSVGNTTSVAAQTGTGSIFAMQAGPTFTGTLGGLHATFTGVVKADALSSSGSSAPAAGSSVEINYNIGMPLGIVRSFDRDGTVYTPIAIRGSTISLDIGATAKLSIAATGIATFAENPIMSSLTASQLVFTDASKGLVSGTDIPTATTIGSAYIYRAGGTDVAVADGGTGASTIGSNTQILFNDSDVVGADSDFTYTKSVGGLSITKGYAGQTGLYVQNMLGNALAAAAFTLQTDAGYVAFNVLSDTGAAGTASIVSTASGGLKVYTSGATTLSLGTNNDATHLVIGTTGIVTLSSAIVGPATATVFNTVSTTVNAFGAATTLNIGAATGTLTVANTTLAAKAGTFSTTLGVTGIATITSGANTGDSTWLPDLHAGWGTGGGYTASGPTNAAVGILSEGTKSGGGWKNAGLFSVKTSTLAATGSYWALGAVGNQDDASNVNDVYAMYAEVWKQASGSATANGRAQGFELSINNLYNGAAATHPYSSSPVGLVEGQRIYAQTLGASTRYAASTGLMIGGDGTSGATFQTGLIFNEYAASATNRAISMAEGHTINWHTSAGGITPVLTLGNTSGSLVVTGGLKVTGLAGTGSRTVVADANGILSAP